MKITVDSKVGRFSTSYVRRIHVGRKKMHYTFRIFEYLSIVQINKNATSEKKTHFIWAYEFYINLEGTSIHLKKKCLHL